ncbi:MAG: hypothetical protein HKN47_21350 [Pirellulaceae bacterium]|nr:hypothetical protein [Pirellulaceae bacterium]
MLKRIHVAALTIITLTQCVSQDVSAQNVSTRTYVASHAIARVPHNVTSFDPFSSPIPSGSSKENLFGLPPHELAGANTRGRLALLHYPTRHTTLAAPFDSINRLYNTQHRRPLVRIGIRRNHLTGIGKSWSHVWGQAGLSSYPHTQGRGAYYIPFPSTGRPTTPIGFSVFSHNNTRAFTISCASCHTRNLFGRPVLGATNLLGGSGNTMFLLKQVATLNHRKFRFATRAGGYEQQTFQNMKHHLSFVHGKRAAGPGLENPVSFVGMSMTARSNDQALSRTYHNRANAYRTRLAHMNTDTKPPVLWNLKYKNRFQHDGSMTGDPMLANLIFNEIGRGSDMNQLEHWIRNNRHAVRDLAAAGYASEAPKWTDFFAPHSIDIVKAKRGEQVFLDRCARCHGEYDKAWSLSNSHLFSTADRLKTIRVTMPEENTIVRNVGTEPGRSMAMTELSTLANRLSIFRNNGISFTANPGSYVPPPLVGIWARWPYMHNNSIPNLDQLLTPANQRTPYFYIGPAKNPNTDYDTAAVGFPINRTPRNWMRNDRLFDTRRPGLSNAGHDEGIFASGGRSELTHQAKYDLIEFLKTL